jgi:hypothetical protein
LYNPGHQDVQVGALQLENAGMMRLATLPMAEQTVCRPPYFAWPADKRLLNLNCRFGWTGPLPAVRRFVADHANFQPDRERELLFTDHSFGYLKRLS